MRHLTCQPGTEVLGAAMLAFIDNMQAGDILPYVKKHGLSEKIDPNAWYPAQKWLDVLNDMADSTDVTSNMVAIGMGIAEHAAMPPQLENGPFEAVLSAWDDIYQMQHRKGEIGYVKVEKLGDGKYKTTHQHLYPDDMSYGIAYGWARRFLPPGTRFVVRYDENIPSLDAGGDITIIHVEWE